MLDTLFNWLQAAWPAIAVGAGITLVLVVVWRLVRRAVSGWLDREGARIIKKYGLRTAWMRRLKNRRHVQHLLLRDLEVMEAIVRHAREHDQSLAEVEDRVRGYVEEMVPGFNLVSYYKIGYGIARLALNFLYKLSVSFVDPSIKELHLKHRVVYVFNHRSNVDFVLSSFALAETIALSYAVGEWARVWPLDRLFRSFGSYFLRRGYREPLYHTVLRRYVQVVSQEGVTQGFFIEGGLSRNGRFRTPKIGLLDYLIGTLKDPEADLLFIPVALNFDRVLEDRVLMGELVGRKETVSRWVRFKRTWRLLFNNFLAFFLRNRRKHGYAAIRFGQPVSARALLEGQEDLFELDRRARLGCIHESLALPLLARIGELVPVTAIPLVATAILDEVGEERESPVFERPDPSLETATGDHFWDQVEVTAAELVPPEDGAPGDPPRWTVAIRAVEDRVAALREELEAARAHLIRADKESAEMTAYALQLLSTRGILAMGRGSIPVDVGIPASSAPLLRYYRNSIVHLLGGELVSPEAAGRRR